MKLSLMLLALTPVVAQPSRAPIAANPVVNIAGKIQKVEIARGQGMPFLMVESEGKVTKVMLGSMRYLMEENFNPKAGSAVKVTGYQVGAEVIAISVNDVTGKRTLKLRDDYGWPLWRGGMRGLGAR